MFFKSKFRKKALVRADQERTPSFLSFSMASKVSFSFLYNEEGIEPVIAAFIDFLKGKGITYSGIGVVMQKTKTPPVPFDENITLISKKDLNFFGLPVSFKTARNFVNDFDIFIDFTPQGDFTCRYIATRTRAKFKIGRTASQGSPYDLVIEQTAEDTSAKAFLDQLFHYLNIIKPA